MTVNTFVPTNERGDYNIPGLSHALERNSWSWTLASVKQRAVFTTKRPDTGQGWYFRKHALSVSQRKFKVMP